MIPSTHRLPGHRIPVLLKNGRRFNGEIASLIFLQNESGENSHIAAIVPVKLSKKAVYRNRTRRLIYESIRQNISEIKPGFEIIIMAKKLFAEEKLSDVQKPIMDLLQKAELLS